MWLTSAQEHRLKVDRIGTALACASGLGAAALGSAMTPCGSDTATLAITSTSMSAWMAPAALIAAGSRSDRAADASAFSPSTSCCSDTPSLTDRELLAVLLHAHARAWSHPGLGQRENGCGWLTTGVSEMVTVRLPCATATVDTRTSRPSR